MARAGFSFSRSSKHPWLSRSLRGRTGFLPLPVVTLTALSVMGVGCKLGTDAKTESFRATQKGWWPFGEEKSAFLLHQYIYEGSSPAQAQDYADPMLNALRGISSCWYPLETETKQIQPLMDKNKISELYDLAPTPASTVAIPLPQLLKSMESVAELRSINDSLDRSAARIVSSFVVPGGFLVDLALCSGALSLVAGSLATGPAAPVVGAGALSAATAACTFVLPMTGATDRIKEPIDNAFNPVNDGIANAVSSVTNDGQRRRAATMQKLQIVQDQQGQLLGSVERSVAEMPQISWEEMKVLNRLVRELGDPSKPKYPDGTPKNLSASMRCQPIPVLKAQGLFYSPDLEELPTGMQVDLRERGYTPQDISKFNEIRKAAPPSLGTPKSLPSDCGNGTSGAPCKDAFQL